LDVNKYKVELAYNIMKELNILCHYKRVLL